MFAVLLPVLIVIAGLLLDGGGLLNEYRIAQHAADAAASAAARALQEGASPADARVVAEQYVRDFNALGSATVTVSIPPISGPLAGNAQSVEVEVVQPASTHFLAFLESEGDPFVRTRAVARSEPSTAGAALVVLDPDPSPLAVPAVGAVLPALPTLLGGLEIIGTSRVRVDGAVLVNTTWGGRDEDGNPAGKRAGPPYGVAVPSLLIPEKLQARDLRVVGGVDNPSNYGNFTAGDPTPLRANRLPVDDPLIGLPAPTTSADPTNVSGTVYGGMTIVDLPLIDPPRTLQPGVYDYLEIVSGDITFRPGVYIIRSVEPVSGIALSILGGRITADGVLFYITDSAGYSPSSGLPDDGDGETVPPPPGVPSLMPSTVIVAIMPGSVFRGLNDSGSVFDGMFIYQRRRDRRPIAIINRLVPGESDIDGIVYAKWGHVILSGSGFQETRVVSGTLRLINVIPSLIAPTNLLPPAEDVFLVE